MSRRSRMFLSLALIVAGLGMLTATLTGCGALNREPVNAMYVDADRKTHDSIAPITADLIDGRRTAADFDEAERQSVHDTLDSWGERISSTEDDAQP